MTHIHVCPRGGCVHFNRRDLKIITLVAHEITNEQIANQLGLHEQTVRNRLSQWYLQLHLRSRVGLVMRFRNYLEKNGEL